MEGLWGNGELFMCLWEWSVVWCLGGVEVGGRKGNIGGVFCDGEGW